MTITQLALLQQFIFNNVNQINHTKFNVNRFPYSDRRLHYTKHATHHIDMKRGNYSRLSPLYDWMFGTLGVTLKKWVINYAGPINRYSVAGSFVLYADGDGIDATQ